MNRTAFIVIGILGVAFTCALGAMASPAWLQPGSGAEPAAGARPGAWYNVNGMAWQLRPNGELIITQCRGQVQVARFRVSVERIVLRLDMRASASCCGWTRLR
jgi:hypothetical protein